MKMPEASQSRSLVVYANDEPKGQYSNPGAHSRYRFPRIEIETRSLQPLPPGSIRVCMNCVGICGTDLHLLEKAEDGYTRCSSPSHIPPTVFHSYDPPELGWEKWVAGGCEIRKISGGHVELLEEPNVAQVASILIRMLHTPNAGPSSAPAFLPPKRK